MLEKLNIVWLHVCSTADTQYTAIVYHNQDAPLTLHCLFEVGREENCLQS